MARLFYIPLIILALFYAVPAFSSGSDVQVTTTLAPRAESVTTTVVFWPSYPGVSNPAMPIRSTPPPNGPTDKLPYGIYTTRITTVEEAGQVKDEATSTNASTGTATTTTSSGGSDAPSTSGSGSASSSGSRALGPVGTDAMFWFVLMGMGMVAGSIMMVL